MLTLCALGQQHPGAAHRESHAAVGIHGRARLNGERGAIADGEVARHLIRTACRGPVLAAAERARDARGRATVVPNVEGHGLEHAAGGVEGLDDDAVDARGQRDAGRPGGQPCSPARELPVDFHRPRVDRVRKPVEV